jgi:hypothetical protein
MSTVRRVTCVGTAEETTMENSSKPPQAGPDSAALAQFSQCHVGILAHLQDLGRLPALLEPAAQARHIAAATLKFFRDAICPHHADEEKDLFPAVLASAARGAEREQVRSLVERLTREHREVEAAFTRLEPALREIARGHDASLEPAAVEALVRAYGAHAEFEEQAFLPLSQTILGRNSDHMAALGLSLHLRHALPEVLARFAGRV